MANTKKNGKIFDKTMVICTAVIAAITLIIVCAVLLPDPIIASVRIREAKDFFENATVENVSVVAPLENNGVFEDKGYILKDDEAAETAIKIRELFDNSKYSKTYAIPETGVWKMNIVSYTADTEYKIYIDESAFYIESGSKIIRYIPTEDYSEKYDEFYNKTVEKLNEK